MSDEPRLCKHCGKPLPAGVTRNQLYHQPLCAHEVKAIQQRANYRRARGMITSTERQRLADKRATFGWAYVDEAPDPEPARALRRELALDREMGQPFHRVFAVEVDYVIQALKSRGAHREAAQWREVFNETKSAWRAAYERSGEPIAVVTREMLGVGQPPKARAHQLA